jgi:hypothetical protein
MSTRFVLWLALFWAIAAVSAANLAEALRPLGQAVHMPENLWLQRYLKQAGLALVCSDRPRTEYGAPNQPQRQKQIAQQMRLRLN